MFRRILAATALAAGISAAAFAQDTVTDRPADGGMFPDTWDQTLTDAFADPATGTLRSADEIQANWGTLTEDQHAEVRAACADMTAMGTGSGGEGEDAAAEITTGSTEADQVAMAELCAWVDTQ